MTTLLDRFSRTFIGIEFKNDSFSIACLKNDLSGIKLLASHVFPLRDDDETLEEINSFIYRNSMQTKEVFVGIPLGWSIIKFIDVPSPKGKSKDALINMMRFEIERHIPYPIEDVFFDFQVVEKSETVYKVMFVVVYKEKIDYVKEFLDKISLKPEIVTLSAFAILNSIEFSETLVGGWQNLLGITKKPNIWGHRHEIYGSLFINDDTAHIAVLRGGFCVHHNSFILNQSNSPAAVVDDIYSKLTVLPPHLSLEKIKKLILSGNTTSLPDLAGALGTKLGINVQTINPVSKFLKSDKNVERPELATLVGLCYSGLDIGTQKINLLPHKPGIALRRGGALVSKISIPFILFLIIGIFAGETVNDKRLLMKIEEKIKENEPEIKFMEGLSREINLFEKQRIFLADSKDNYAVLTILSELSKIIPQEIWLTNFHYKETGGKDNEALKGELQISGYADSSSVLISILEDSTFFEKVEFVGPITKRRDKEGFKIKALIIRPAKTKETVTPQIKKRRTTSGSSIKS